MKYRFGEKIRAIRDKRGMTMKEVAEKIGVTESLISQIERNKVSPAVDTLLSISEVLSIDLEYLFEDLKKNKAVQVIKKDDRNRFESQGVVYEQLSSYGTGSEHGIESYYLEIDAGKEKGSSDYGHIGMEMGIILNGRGELDYGTEKYMLESGDSISFSSDIPHVLRNVSSGKLKAFWVVTPPKGFFREV
jgi:transcriptional regulator with XRE-family HTH domain